MCVGLISAITVNIRWKIHDLTEHWGERTIERFRTRAILKVRHRVYNIKRAGLKNVIPLGLDKNARPSSIYTMPGYRSRLAIFWEDSRALLDLSYFWG